ncbi:MAG: type II secretion system F family protein, partial [Candidatus Omnitrophota bacterium]|nr:type II secretion system F family protein [Candidatus Omnitrophota bacterium]
MVKFVYRAKKGPGEGISGSIEAESRDAAFHKLASMGYFPLSVEQEDAEKPDVRTKFLSLFKKIAVRDISIFTRQLSDLLEAGLPLVKALMVLQRQTENKKLRNVIADIKEFVQDGNHLSSALKRHPGSFSSLYVSMVMSGETAGNLESVLLRLAEYHESQEELNTKIRSAMAYPALMGTVGLATIFVLITFVIPKIVTIFQELNQALPLPTVILLNISGFIRKFWLM